MKLSIKDKNITCEFDPESLDEGKTALKQVLDRYAGEDRDKIEGALLTILIFRSVERNSPGTISDLIKQTKIASV